MKKIILSISSLIFAVAILAGGTGAFLNSQNTSTGNTFATGIIDLKIDNESYVTDNDGNLVFSSSTSWALSSLAGKLFFNFLDLKPGDVGEDTISLHVHNNNAWACMDIKMTSTPENGQPEPELLVDQTLGVNEGELQNFLYFVFWGDDGDNVFETGEMVFKKGLVKDIFDGKDWTIADSGGNIWKYNNNDPIKANTTKYIGKAWCFGELTETPVNQDNKGKTGNNGPLVRGTGISCEGKDVGNIVQSDGIKADVSFYVEQSRSNSRFLCKDGDDHDYGDDDDEDDDDDYDHYKKEYCSPGYWKQSHHFDSWVGYSPNQQFSSVFDNAFPGKTLLQVLKLGNGALNKLGRETVTALLNSKSIDSVYTEAEVIAQFNALYPGASNSEYEALADEFQINENCPLN